MTHSIIFRRLALLLAALAAVAMPSAMLVAAPTADAPSEATQGYILGTGDVVEVAVLGRDEFKSRVQVQVDGTIQLPFLKSVEASNKTVIQLRDHVRRLLVDGGFYADPVVTVSIATFASRYVTVLGSVGSPGIVPVDRAYRISEILARVGGAKDDGADMLSLRRADGTELKLAVRDISSGGPAEDPYVAPGDKIYLPAAETFYIYGQVASPGNFKLDRDMTLRKAIARSGGITERGSERRIKLFRAGKEIGKVGLEEPLKGGDVVNVGERLF